MSDRKLCPYKLLVGSFNQCDADKCQWWWKCKEPNPAPEPPKVGIPITRQEAIDTARDIMLKAERERIAQAAPSSQPEAKLPDTLEQAVNELQDNPKLLESNPMYANLAQSCDILRQRLAALQPTVPSVTELTFALWETGAFQKRATAQDCARHLVNKFGSRVGQLEVQTPSVEAIIQWLKEWHGEGYYSEAGFEREATEFRTWLLSRMGQAPQSELDKAAADELTHIEARCETVPSQPAPSPVTAEKLVEQIRTIPNPWSGDVDLFQNIRLATRQGFEECREAVLKLVRSQGLAQPALTREQVEEVAE